MLSKMKVSFLLSVFLINAFAVESAKYHTRGLFMGFGEGRKGGKGGKGGKDGRGIEHFCQKLSESAAGECPTRNGGCPERPICKEDGANGSLDAFCADIAAVEDCDVDTDSCLEILESCGCVEPIDCSTVGTGFGGGSGSTVARRGGRGDGQGRLNHMCQKFVEHSASGSTGCPTRNGACPAHAICGEGDGSTDDFCNVIDALDDCSLTAAECNGILDSCGCNDEEIDCESLEWGGRGGN